MTAVLKGEHFRGRISGVVWEDLVLEDCEFTACVIARDNGRPQNRLERIEVKHAAQLNCSIRETLLRDVRLHGLKRLGDAPLFLWGCLFERVTLSGRISAVKINRSITLPEPLERQRVHDAATIQFYAISDWALDISRAEFPGGVSFEAIPGDKVRRDPTRQVLVSRAALAEHNWRAVDYDGTAINIELGWFESKSLFNNIVLAARCDRKWAKRDQAVFRRLCDAGIASV
jgi:hypothetical protein